MKLHHVIYFITITLSTLSLSACDTSRLNDEPIKTLNLALSNSIENSIIPDFNTFKAEQNTFQSQVTLFCSAINQNNLSRLQNQWKSLSSSWNRVVMYNIGPLNNDLIFPSINFIESMRQRGTDYTETIRGELATILVNATVLDEDYFNALVFTKTGMLALEVLVFEESNNPHSTDLINIVNDYQANSRKCDYLNGMSQLLESYVNDLTIGWEINYLTTGKSFKNILIDEELSDGAESVPALITAIQEHLDYIKKRKLISTQTLDAKISNYFYQNTLSSLIAIEELLEGTNVDSYSLFDHMTSSNFQLTVDLVKNNIQIAKDAATANDISDLSNAIGTLDGNFKREIPQALNVQLGINFTDGD